jgi:uncharacterized Fe-S radical SAM superfamily protein PflX
MPNHVECCTRPVLEWIPMLWNSNFFMSAPTLKILRLLMDVWLPDLKFGPGRCAVNLSRTPHGARKRARSHAFVSPEARAVVRL